MGAGNNTPLLQHSMCLYLLRHHADLRPDVGSRDDMPLEVHLIGIKTQGQTYELRQVENRQINLLSCLCLGPRLVSVQVQVAEGTGGYHKISTVLFGLAGVLGHHSERVFLVGRKDRKATALSLAA